MDASPRSLQDWLNDLAWRHEDLAKAAGVSESTVDSIIAGRHSPHPSTRSKIIEALSRKIEQKILPTQVIEFQSRKV